MIVLALQPPPLMSYIHTYYEWPVPTSCNNEDPLYGNESQTLQLDNSRFLEWKPTPTITKFCFVKNEFACPLLFEMAGRISRHACLLTTDSHRNTVSFMPNLGGHGSRIHSFWLEGPSRQGVCGRRERREWRRMVRKLQAVCTMARNSRPAGYAFSDDELILKRHQGRTAPTLVQLFWQQCESQVCGRASSKV